MSATPKTGPRIAPLAPPYSAAVATQLGRWMPPGAPLEPLVLFRVLCRNLPLAEAMRALGSFQLSKRSGLTRRQRELVIERTSGRLGAEYEWGVHAVAFAAAAGLNAADLAATTAPGSRHWSGVDALVIRLVDALVDRRTIDDDLWDELAAVFTAEQLLELVVLCGWYHLIGFVVNVAKLEPEPWAARFPTGSGVQ